jgi:Mrp family chromosome partitioning ATPase/capsular polysaccharide biosynthesis protein
VAYLGWILVVAGVVTAAAAAFSFTRTPMYRAEVDVLVAPRLLSETAAPQPPDMGTEKAIVSSGVVISAASAALLIPPEALSEGLSVDVPVDTNVLKVQYTHTDPREARRRAQGVAEAYVAFHARQRPPTATQDTGDAGGPAALAGMVQGVIITPAGVPRDPATPNHPIDLGVALIVGLALGLGSAVVRDRLDDRLRGPQDFEAQAGEPVLAAIPAFRTTGRDPAARLVTVGHPASRAAAAFRDLRTRTYQAVEHRGARILLVASAAGRDRSGVAANLAITLAQAGRRVVLVCADLRDSRTQELFGVAGESGLSDRVGPGPGTAVPLPIRRTGVPGLRLVPAGPAPADPGAVLQAPALPTLLRELTISADLVVVEGPPLLAAAEATVLVDLVDMVLVCGDFRRVTRAQVRAAISRIEPARHKLIGCVLDNVGLRTHLWRRSAQPAPAPDDTDDEPARDNGRYVGRVPSSTLTTDHPAIDQETTPN